jgi:uncharacterized protein (TIGR02757 family)
VNQKLLKRKLDYHYKQFDSSQIYPDPLIFPHRFSNKADIELSAFISSIFAYGNVKQIINSLEKLHSLFGNSPREFIVNFNKKEHITFFKKFKHRFYTGNDTEILFNIIKYILTEYGSLKELFLLSYSNDSENIKESLSAFSKKLNNIALNLADESRGVKFMFPNPKSGSACKRMNLFLRWMVRKDELDFGLWNEIYTNKLIIPVDTHIANISRKIGLTKRKIADWKMAEEITENLKKFDSHDPIKYDFAICHIGMRKLLF